jgi:hypothetical protein
VPAALSAQGTSYVLIGNSDETRDVLLSVHNPTSQSQTFDILSIAADTAGITRSTPSTQVAVPAGRTMVYSDLAQDDPSMVELTAHGELTFQAFLMPLDSAGKRVGLREQIPIVDSESLVRGGSWAFVSGLRRDSYDRSDYAILNLSHAANRCEHRVRSHDGHWARESTVLSHRPLSLTYVSDVLLVVGVELGDRYTISTNCADNFYVAALVSDHSDNQISVLEPSQSGISSLTPPGYGEPPTTPDPPEPPPPPPDGCPSGWTCLEPARTDHTVKRKDLQYILRAGLKAGTYGAVKLEFNLRTKDIDPAGAQIFWLGINRHRDLLGFTVQRRSDLFVRHGLGVTHTEKARLVLPRALTPNQTYKFSYSYNAGGEVSLCVTDSREKRFCSRGSANVDSLTFTASDRLVLIMGSDGTEEIEPPQWGWAYSNIKLRARRN